MRSEYSYPDKGMSKQAYRDLWRERIKGWRASGQSKSAYAAANGFSTDALHDWIRRFELAALSATQTRSNETDKQIAPKESPTIIPVRVHTNSGGITTSPIKLLLCNGVILEWTQPPQAIWLAELLRGLA